MAALAAGEVAPAIAGTVTDAEGTERAIAAALDRGPLLLGIYKSSCQASKTVLPLLDRLHRRYANRGLTVYGVSQDSPNVTRSFARRYGVTFPLLIEGGKYPVSRAFDIFATPTVYLIRPGGTIAFTTMGFLRDQMNELGDAVADVMDLPPEPLITEADSEIPLFVPG